MTATIIPAPVQAGVATTVRGPLAVAAGESVPRSNTRPSPNASQGAFSALFLALRPNTATPADARLAATTAAAAGVVQASQDAASTAWTAGIEPLPAPPEAAASGSSTGEALPADGNDLPPPDVTTLLASLAPPGALPGALPDAVPGAAAPLTPITAPTDGVPAPPTPMAPITGQPAAAANPAQAMADRAGMETRAPAADPSVHGQPHRADPDALPLGNDTASVATADSSTPTADQTPLPSDARARLDALLQAAPRLTAGSETGAAPILATTPATGSAAPGSAPAAQPATALPFDASPALEPLADRDAWSQNLGDRLLLMAERGVQSATLRLHPEHLGQMQIRIHVDEDGSAQVLFSAQQAPTRDALEHAIPRLRELFADQGLNLMQANVDAGRNGFAQRGFAAAAPAWSNWSNDEHEAATLAAAPAWQIQPLSSRRVDIFV